MSAWFWPCLGLALALVGQGASPFHLLTHEASQGASLILALAGWALPEPPQRPARARFVELVMAGAAFWATQALLQEQLHGCRPGSTALFFWSVYLPLIALVAAFRARCGHWSLGRQALLVGVVVLAAVVHDLGQVLRGVALVDPILGEPLFLDQRAPVELRPLHLIQRAWLLSTAAALLWPAWRPGWVLLTALGGSSLGLGWGRARQEAELDQALVTPNFELRFAGRGQAALHAPRLAEEAEWWMARISAETGLAPAFRVRLHVYEDHDELRRISGASSARAGLGWIDLHWWDFYDETLPHELIHAVHYSARPNPLIVLSRTHLEGTAQAYGDALHAGPAFHQAAAAALKTGHLPALADLLSPTAFWRLKEGVAYEASGSFLGFLAATRGWDRLFAWQRQPDLSLERTYGASVNTLDQEWRAWLATTPLQLDEVFDVRQRFDPTLSPGYLDRSCPKLEAKAEPRPDLARRLVQQGHSARALGLLADLAKDEPDRSLWPLLAGRALSDLDRRAESRATFEGLLTRAALAPDERVAALDPLRQVLLRQGDWEALEANYAERLALQPDPGLEALRRLLARPELREPLVAVLREARPEDLGASLLPLVQAWPDLTDLTTFALARLTLVERPWAPHLTARERELVARALERLPTSPVACDLLRDDLFQAGRVLAREGSRDQVASLSAALRTSCQDPRAAWQADWLEARARRPSP